MKKPNILNNINEFMQSAVKKILHAGGLLDRSGDSFFDTKLFLCGVSVFISVLIWTFVAWDGNTEGTRSISVPIQYINLTKGYSIYTQNKRIEIRFAGRLNSLANIEESDISATVDLQGMQIGSYSLPIKADGPQSVRIRSQTPTLAEVEIYRYVERTIPVTWKPDETASGDAIISNVQLSPSEATISGPENDVLSVQSIEALLPIDKNNTSEVKAPLRVTGVAPDSAQRIKIMPSAVNAKVMFEEEVVAERIPVRVSVVGVPADDMQIDSIKVVPDRVSVKGRGDLVRKMQSIVLPPVDITGLDQNLQLMIPLQPTDLDPGIEIEGPDRARVDIIIRNKMTTKTFSSVGIMVAGIDENKDWKVQPQYASVTIEGTQAALNMLQSGHVPFELYVDVSNIVSHQIELPVLVRNLKKDFQIVKIEPEEVSVSIVN